MNPALHHQRNNNVQGNQAEISYTVMTMTQLEPQNRSSRKPVMVVEDDDPLPKQRQRRGWHLLIDRDLLRVRIPRTRVITSFPRTS